jgi:hypothetical protein
MVPGTQLLNDTKSSSQAKGRYTNRASRFFKEAERPFFCVVLMALRRRSVAENYKSDGRGSSILKREKRLCHLKLI